jgi:hypothetical protein
VIPLWSYIDLSLKGTQRFDESSTCPLVDPMALPGLSRVDSHFSLLALGE